LGSGDRTTSVVAIDREGRFGTFFTTPAPNGRASSWSVTNV